jgi:hypothetical protein
MAEGKKSFLLYCDLIHTVKKMPDEKAGQLLKHVLEYVNDGNPETDDLIIQLVFEPIKQQLKRDLNKWETEIDRKSNSGKLGNLKRWNLDLYELVVKMQMSIEEAEKIALNRKESQGIALRQNESQGIANIAVNDNVNDTVNVSVNVKEEKKLPANRRVNIFSDLFTLWFKDKFELSYSMKTKDFVGIATIEKYCKENAKGVPIEMFRFILENYDALPEFYQTNINPSFIASRISEIASMLKKQHTKTQIVKQGEDQPVNRKWFPSPSQYYSECISKKQEPFNFWTGNEMTEEEKISEYKIHKVGEYRYA